MKTNRFADLINFGLSQKTLMNLSEGEINTLHKNLIEGKKTETKEQGTPQVVNKTIKQVVLPPNTQTTVGNVSVSNQGGKTTVTPTTEGEVSETKKTEKTKKEKYNPWAICHAQVGPKKTPKFERCVKQVKKSISEGKNPFSVILENKIVSLLEKHVQPKMMKKELLDLIGKNKMKTPIGKMSSLGMMENDTETAPAKPVTKPGTKNPPKPKPFDPYRPKPGYDPNPKAKKKYETKENETETAPVIPVKEPDTKPVKPEKPFNPYRPKPGYDPNPKAKTKAKEHPSKRTDDRPEFLPPKKIEIGRRWKEDDNKKKKEKGDDKKKEERIFRPSNKSETFEQNNPTIAPPKPVTKPGTKTPPKPFDPYRPKPGYDPNPKAKTKLPQWLTFKNLGINLK